MSSSDGHAAIAAQIEAIYRRDGRRIFATLVRLLGDMDRAEDALHEACRAALEQWPAAGVPANPAAWLVSAGRFKAIDALRRDARLAPWDDAAAARTRRMLMGIDMHRPPASRASAPAGTDDLVD